MKSKQRAQHSVWVTDVDDDLILREELDATLACPIAGIATVDGNTGTGKTEAVRRWAAEQQHPTIYVQIDEDEHHSVNVDDLLYRELAKLGAVDLEYVHKLRRPVDRRHLLNDLMAAEDRIVITDEAGTASRSTFTRLRTMNDRYDASWTWIIVGQDCVERMRRLGLEPCGNRLIGQHESEGLDSEELLTYLAKYHAAYAGADTNRELAALIGLVDTGLAERRPGGTGNRRSWDTFTYRFERLTHRGATLTREHAEDILGGMKRWEPDDDGKRNR